MATTTTGAIDSNLQFPLSTILSAGTVDAVRDELRLLFWSWFDRNNTISIKFKISFIPVSIKVAKLEPLFVLLFGAHPVTTAVR